jgi:hypothetical protein
MLGREVSRQLATTVFAFDNHVVFPGFGLVPVFHAPSGRYVDFGAVPVPLNATFSAWVSLQAATSGGYIITKGYDGANTQLQMYVGSSGLPAFGSYNGSVHEVVSAVPVSTTDLSLVTGVYDGATYRIYVDGLLRGSSVDVSPVATSQKLLIGAVDASGSVVGHFGNDVGFITDARVYGRALSAAEVWALYDPRTRWDLYWVPGRRVYGDLGAGGGGGGFKAAWAARSNVILQPGVR